MLCVVDDAQWLDRASAQALAFVARRLRAEAVALVFAEREPSRELAGLPELVVAGLADDDARALLESVVTGPLDERVRDRIVAETRGNPLALIELPHGLTHAELAGGFGLPTGSPLSGRIEESFRRRLSRLPPTSRELLLVAAAEPVGDPLTVWRAAELLGVGAQAAGPGVARRPRRVRRARAIPPPARAIGRLPVVVAGRPPARAPRARRGDRPGRRPRPPSLASRPRDAGARRGRRRRAGGVGRPSAGARRPRRGGRVPPACRRPDARAGAARAPRTRRRAVQPRGRRAGWRPRAPCHGRGRSRSTSSSAPAPSSCGPQIRFAVDRGRDAPPLLLAAARRLETLDAKLSRETYLDAFSAALFAGRLAQGAGVREVAEAVLAANWGESGGQLPRACDLLLEGVAVLTTQGYAAGAPTLKRALSAFRDEPMSEEDALRWLWLACRVARALGDDATWDALTDRQVRLARKAGALSLLPIALIERFGVQLFFGDLREAQSLVAEAEAVVEATGSHLAPQGAIALAAWRGSEEEVSALIEAGRQEVERRGEGLWLIATEWASAVLFNSLGRYSDALAVSEQAGTDPHELGVSTWVPTEFIEAAVRAGVPERAAAPLRRLQEISRASGTDWALGVEARSRALVSEGERPSASTARRSSGSAAPASGSRSRARTSCTGSGCAGEGRRVEARAQLRIAHESYAAMGMEGFAERARRELVATGETVRKRSVEARDELTAQEAQIARLAADGRTNPEIARSALHQPPHGRVAPAQGVQQARGQVTQGPPDALPSLELEPAST